MSELSARLAQRADELGWSARRVAAEAAEHGFTITHAAVADYLRGRAASRPKEQTLKALATALDLPLSELRTLAGLPAGELEPYEAPPEADRLDDRQRRALNELIRAIAAGQEGRDAAPITDAGGTPAHVTDLPRAARRSPGDKERRAREARRRGEESQEPGGGGDT